MIERILSQCEMTDFSRVIDSLGTQFVELSESESYVDLFVKSIFHEDPAIQILTMALVNSCLVFVLGLITKQYRYCGQGISYM